MPELTILFDLDGTLVDTARDLLCSLNHALDLAGLQPFGSDQLGHLVGQGGRVMVQRALALRGRAPSDAEFDTLHRRFTKHYNATIPGESQPYPGAITALTALRLAGHRLAVCTNKDEALARKLLRSLGMSHHFSVVAGGDTFGVKKPDGRHLRQTIAKAGGVSESSIMIGDSSNDVFAAKDAGVICACVSFGYCDLPLPDLNADAVIDSFNDLTPAYVQSLLKKCAT